MKKIKILLIFSTILILNFFSIIGGSNSVYVDSDGNSDFISIQDAIDSSNEGDFIYVQPGLYEENIVIDKNISLIGLYQSNTTLIALNSTIITINSNNVLIQGFTISYGDVAIKLEDSSECILKNNTFQSNIIGVEMNELSSNNFIYNNNFVDNEIHAIDKSSNNWDYQSKGNYWDNYSGYDINNDGIGEQVYNITGADNEDSYPIINPITISPHADFWYTPTNPKTNTNINFSDISYDLDGEIVKWIWDFGDNKTSTNQNPIHQYEDDGVYFISLTVFDNLGARNSQIYTISISNVQPTAYFTHHPEVPLDIQEVDFNDESTDSDGNIVNWTWYVDDIKIQDGSFFKYTFPDDGTYKVTLSITDDDSATSSFSETVTVLNVGPTASFSFYTDNGSIYKNSIIHFNDNSKDQDGNIISYNWDFGDGAKSEKNTPTHSYSQNGNYKVTLTIEDDDGVFDSISKNIRVGPLQTNENPLAGISIFEIIIVIGILCAVALVFFVNKKYSRY